MRISDWSSDVCSSDLQSDGNDVEGYRQALEQTATELETILRTFESLINIAQAEAGLNRLTLAALDLSALAQDLLEVYQPIAEEAGLELTGAIDPGVTISGHRQLLGQALANLLDNAVKYSPRGGQIRMSLGRIDEDRKSTSLNSSH